MTEDDKSKLIIIFEDDGTATVNYLNYDRRRGEYSVSSTVGEISSAYAKSCKTVAEVAVSNFKELERQREIADLKKRLATLEARQ